MNQTNTHEANPVLSELKKATDLWMNKTYNESEFYSHILQIIRENDTGARHKEQLERLMFKVDELMTNQAMVWSGHKNMIPICKKQERELIEKIRYLQAHGGYSIMRFKIEKPQQTRLL